MTPVRFSMAVLAASVLFAATTPAQKARILWREYQARRDALSKSIGPDALFYLRTTSWAVRSSYSCRRPTRRLCARR